MARTAHGGHKRSRWSPAHSTPALLISIAALVIATAGTAIGAARYLISSSGQIKPGTIVGANVHRGTLTAANLAPSALRRLHPSIKVVRNIGTIPAGGTASVSASCPGGAQATGGGFGNDGPLVIESRPQPTEGTPTGWIVTAQNTTVVPAAQQQSVYAICSG
jgi:hypothetical protein